MSSLFFADVQFLKRWGFAIYRTDYSSEENWIKFTSMLDTWSSPVIENKGPEEAPLIESWKQMWWMSDKNKFENASHGQLRQHFNTWLDTLSTKERSITRPEHYMFLVVDKNILDIIHSQPPEYTCDCSGTVPYVLALDKDAPNENSDYPASMKVDLRDLMYLYEEGLERESMRGLRLRSSEWFKRDEISLEDMPTFGEE